MKNFKSIALTALQGKPFEHPMLERPHLTDLDQIFGAAFGHHLY